MPIQTYLYDPYGNILNVSNDPINNFTFVGRYGGQKDWDTGLIQFQHRWYDGNTGRWISRDPIGIKAGINVFQYSLNNPTNRIDASGFCSNFEWDWKCIDKYAWQADVELTKIIGVQAGGMVIGITLKRTIGLLFPEVSEKVATAIDHAFATGEGAHTGYSLVDAYFVVDKFFSEINENCHNTNKQE
jgi:RHS repeat-associated protein